MRERRGADDGSGRPLGFFERLMFSFMGPPQVGANTAREGYVPDPQDDLCPKCHQPWAGHERVVTGSMTYRRCPVPRGG